MVGKTNKRRFRIGDMLFISFGEDYVNNGHRFRKGTAYLAVYIGRKLFAIAKPTMKRVYVVPADKLQPYFKQG